MAYPTAVNEQITDAVTQTNVKVLGDQPAQAIGTLYQAVAQALGLAAENAVMAQQQINILTQATTAQGVNQIYTLDSIASNEAAHELSERANAAPSKIAETVAVAVAAPVQTATSVQQTVASADAALAATGLSSVEQGLQQIEKITVDHAGAWSRSVDEVMEAVAYSLAGLQQANFQANLDVVKVAAYASILRRLIECPEKLPDYQALIETIQAL